MAVTSAPLRTNVCSGIGGLGVLSVMLFSNAMFALGCGLYRAYLTERHTMEPSDMFGLALVALVLALLALLGGV